METYRNTSFQASPKETMRTRRRLLASAVTGVLGGLLGGSLVKYWNQMEAETFIAKVPTYSANITATIINALSELDITANEIKGKRILLKPNLVEVVKNEAHINTHPLVIRGAIEAFFSLGASKVIVAEGQGHTRDSIYVLEESGLAEVLVEDRIPFADLNNDSLFTVPNKGRFSELRELTFPQTLKKVDIVVSMPKLKTHHWAGVTLSMKNMFGVMPGIVYGWPKNVLHHAGLQRAILDINTTFQSHLAIVDGITGMEGDGPIMGTPRDAGVLVVGRNLTAVDATCTRIMGIEPTSIPYLKVAANRIGPVKETRIEQRGELIRNVCTKFKVIEDIPAHKALRAYMQS